MARVARDGGLGRWEPLFGFTDASEPTMPDLTTTQILVLTSACERTDGIAIRPATLNRSAAVKVAAKLIERGLVQEQRAKRDWPVWRLDVDGKAFSLRILKPGRAVMKATSGQNNAAAATTGMASSLGAASEAAASGDAGQPISSDLPKSGGKRILVLALMRREGGATIADLVAATGWLPHTTRAALTGLRKSGIAITRSRDAQATSSVYRIEQPASAVAA